MAVLIAEMDVPKECNDCLFCYRYETGGSTEIGCEYLRKKMLAINYDKYSRYGKDNDGFKFDDCPLEPVTFISKMGK